MRGIAVCGILAVNIFVMGTVGSTQGRTFPAQFDHDWIAWGAERIFLEGPMRGLFTMLFGAGMLMMLKRAEGPEGLVLPIDVWTRRCLLLLFFGVIQFLVLMWPGEILWTYGIAGLALLAFRTAKVRTLWIWTFLIIASLSIHRAYDTSTYLSAYENALAGEQTQALGLRPTTEQQVGLDAVKGANAANYPTVESLSEKISERTKLHSLIAWSAKEWSSRHLEFYSWIGVAESLAFMLAGMALYRSGVLTGMARSRTYWLLLLFGGAIGLGLRFFDVAWQARTGFELDIHRMVPAVSILRSGWYQPARLALTIAYVALIVLMMRSKKRFWIPPFRALGRTALTTYTLQSILTSLLFYAFGYLGSFGAAELMLVTLGICIITCSFNLAWLSRAPMGPAEWLLRAFAYGSFSPKRRAQAAEVVARGPSV
jgi:uncharacterized protein